MLGRLISIIFVMFFLVGCSSLEVIRFENTESNPTEIKAYLAKPEGNGPFAAIILLHGCTGLELDSQGREVWRGLKSHASALNEAGYVTFIVDSHGSRGISTKAAWDASCRYGRGYRIRVHDVYGAISYLENLPYVKKGAIGAVGLSQGGSVVINTLSIKSSPPNNDGLSAGVAFYPDCQNSSFGPFTNPVLILIGGADDITLSGICEYRVKVDQEKALQNSTISNMEIVVYPGVHHSFDLPIRGTWSTPIGTVSGDHKAASDARKRMIAFFKQHLTN